MSQRLEPDQAEVPAGLTLQVSDPAPHVHMITVGGELDMVTTPHLLEWINAELGSTALDHFLVLDLDGLSFMGSNGLAALLATRGKADKRGVELRLICTSTVVLRPLKVTGLATEFSIHATLADALAQI